MRFHASLTTILLGVALLSSGIATPVLGQYADRFEKLDLPSLAPRAEHGIHFISSRSASPLVPETPLIQEASQLQDPEDVPPPAAETVDPQTQESLAPLQNRPLTIQVSAVSTSEDDIGTDLVPTPAPGERWSTTTALPDGIARGAMFQCVHWAPSLICHHPLYFQEVMLERHGHDRFGYLQPVASGTRFVGTIFLLPYLKTLKHSCSCEYALGYHRAGSCAPCLKDHIPWDKRAAAVETLSVAGFFWAMPL